METEKSDGSGYLSLDVSKTLCDANKKFKQIKSGEQLSEAMERYRKRRNMKWLEEPIG